LQTILNYIDEYNVHACGLSFEINAKLTDEASYYMYSYQDILTGVSAKGNEIMASLTQ